MGDTPAAESARRPGHDRPPPAAVHAAGLRKRYGEVRAVDGVDLTIAPGEVVALLGPNGAGKSTTVDMILGLTRPDDGEVRVFGRSPAEAVREGLIGAVLQEGALLDDATVGEIVGMVASLHRRPLPVGEALRRAGVEDLRTRRSTRLSGGQKQRVRFAVALVCDPGLLLLDEPTAGMDVATRREFWASMRDFTSSGRTVIFATHYLEEAEEFADKVVFLRKGRVVADGPIDQVRRLTARRTLRARVPGASLGDVLALPAVAEASVDGAKVVLVSSDSDVTLRALLGRFPGAHGVEVAGAGLDEVFLSLTSEGTGR
ncbi:ABC transporter ATP-binding protein [Sphaerisporangium sp. TRM90804]|uniref:ABC transporter ATP-binding protein n=1 Tax=Sphaerisporangium sp. TRM90804 TaxID=3031113 RepID=UPI002446B4A0|nr:ABC transporter ATP-binding protein [Sphaerisporangium sp. TRM90804]MDH2426885.1 ABC transporter ATP-binding protein [Sphaerisporangium sp. TRM90804]